jgi:transposase-like protein
MSTSPVNYKRHRIPPQVIAHAVWLYFRFPLSLRLIEEMLLESGIVVSYAIRRWGLKFGLDYVAGSNDIWRWDEVSSVMQVRNIDFGEPSVRTNVSLTRLSRAAAKPRLPRDC